LFIPSFELSQKAS